MTGLIAIEEAFQVPELAHQALNHAQGETAQRLAANLVDIHDQRLKYMDQEGVVFRPSSEAHHSGAVTDLTWSSGIVGPDRRGNVGAAEVNKRAILKKANRQAMTTLHRKSLHTPKDSRRSVLCQCMTPDRPVRNSPVASRNMGWLER
jgi:hypothetical protein